MQNTTKSPALSRTWKATVEFFTHDENWGGSTYTVTLTRETVNGPLSAVVDDQPASVERAVKLLNMACRVEMVEEILATEPVTIGKNRAHKLHKIMGRLGLQEHYGIATRATGRQVFSLATLTELEAKDVWNYLLNMFPLDAPRAAA